MRINPESLSDLLLDEVKLFPGLYPDDSYLAKTVFSLNMCIQIARLYFLEKAVCKIDIFEGAELNNIFISFVLPGFFNGLHIKLARCLGIKFFE